LSDYQAVYRQWLADEHLDEPLRQELAGLTDQKEVEDRFYRRLSFGTGGLRGMIGAGTNRINVHTIRWATEGLARFLVKHAADASEKGVVIAYDTRWMSREFAEAACGVLTHHGIRVYLFDKPRPTPMLSYAVRRLRAAAGIVITASHNPPAYNGFKVYGEDGGQITPVTADQIFEEMGSISNELAIPFLSISEGIEKGLVLFLGKEMDAAYRNELLGLSYNQGGKGQSEVRIVYTPLHGTGLDPMRDVLAAAGFSHVIVVPEQEQPDPDFSTVEYPNPEEKKAFELALRLGQRAAADIILATDPDADRLGIVVRNSSGEFDMLTGNQAGVLLLSYLLERKQERGELPENGVILKTIVTSELGRVIASTYQVATVDTLTGFKYIAEKVEEFHRSGTQAFLFGYEESCGYLLADFVRDKDAIQAALLICEMAAFYKERGVTLCDVLEQLYRTHGYYRDELLSIPFTGKEGQEKMDACMQRLRSQPPVAIGSLQVREWKDYLQGIDGLPKADVLKYVLSDGSWVAIRPSGTEPKMKIYMSAVGPSAEGAEAKLIMLKEFASHLANYTQTRT
jgi:phosphoglucomutase